MHTQLVMTVIGTDHPGLVESVSRVVAARGGNWLESRMARLAGQFAGILRIEGPSAQADALIEDLRKLERAGLKIVIVRAGDELAEQPPHRVHLELAGSDHPGIVHDVTEVLAARGVNIEELSTEVRRSPVSGPPIFSATAVLQVPANVPLPDLSRALEAVAADLMVDITLSEEHEAQDRPGQ